MYEHLPIKELKPGEQIAGRYRGATSDRKDADGPTSARIFLETRHGPVAVSCDARVLAKLRKLNVSDGHRIMVIRLSASVYHVVPENLESA
jgi:hypothetical protein